MIAQRNGREREPTWSSFSRTPGLQKPGTPETRDSRSAGLQNCRTAGLRDSRTPGLQNCGTPELRDSRTAGLQNCGTPELRDSRTADRSLVASEPRSCSACGRAVKRRGRSAGLGRAHSRRVATHPERKTPIPQCEIGVSGKGPRMDHSVDDRCRAAPMARREEGAYSPYVTDEQRCQWG
jgi:hypothetical protein